MSLDLNPRQRAMLREMNVPVWWPKPVAPIVAPQPVMAQPARLVIPLASKPVHQIESRAPSQSTPQSAPQPAPLSARTRPPDSAPTSASTLSWPALQQAVSGCQACALCEGRKQTVFGVGQPAPDLQNAPQVDWLIVGEAPGEN